MKKLVLTCPFTGLDFNAIRLDNGDIVCANPITKEEVRMFYDPQSHVFIITPHHLKHIELATYAQAADVLGVSMQRVGKLCKDGILQSVEYKNGSKLIAYDSVVKYKQTRKTGAPRKKA